MELLQLQYFKLVADTQKITTAAKALYISPPALSATISRLEKELGCRLFDRTNNSITLNAKGEAFLKYVNQILNTLETAKAELQKSNEQEQEHIRVAVTTSNLWIGLICAFSLEHPEITLSYTTLKLSQLPGATLSPRYQFLMAEKGDLDNSSLETEVLFSDDRPVLMVNPANPLAKQSSIDLRDIPSENFFLPVADLSLHKMAMELLSLAKVKVQSAYECTYMVRRSMVMSGRGVSFSTVYTSKGEDPNIRYIPIDYPYYRWTQCIYYDKGKTLQPGEELFLKFSKDYFLNMNREQEAFQE